VGIVDYFKKVNSMTVGEVREFLKNNKPDDYNLVDVRQPNEYEKGHLPGARLIPVGELRDHLRELDPAKPTIAY
jgi:rhodanese-related sulfurtransferase